jgi:hypothetical protein
MGREWGIEMGRSVYEQPGTGRNPITARRVPSKLREMGRSKKGIRKGKAKNKGILP